MNSTSKIIMWWNQSSCVDLFWVWPLDELQRRATRLTSLLYIRPPFTTLTFLVEALTKSYSHISVSVRRRACGKCGTASLPNADTALSASPRAPHTSFITATRCLVFVWFSCVKVKDTFQSFQDTHTHTCMYAKKYFNHLSSKVELLWDGTTVHFYSADNIWLRIVHGG